MTNREKITKTAIYDMLLKIQRNAEKQHGSFCIVAAISGGNAGPEECNRRCEKCLQKWLNEKH